MTAFVYWLIVALCACVSAAYLLRQWRDEHHEPERGRPVLPLGWFRASVDAGGYSYDDKAIDRARLLIVHAYALTPGAGGRTDFKDAVAGSFVGGRN